MADAAGAVGEDILAGGDALGPGIAGEAIVQGRRAAEALHARLRGQQEGLAGGLGSRRKSTADRRAVREQARQRRRCIRPCCRRRNGCGSV